MSDLPGLSWKLYQDPQNLAALNRIVDELTAAEPTVSPLLTADSPEVSHG